MASRTGSASSASGVSGAIFIGELKALPVGLERQGLHGVAQALAPARTVGLDLQPPGLDLREIENTLMTSEGSRRGLYEIEVLALLRPQRVCKASSVIPMMAFIGVRIS